MTNEKLYKIPVGDWSDDGHGECDNYYITTNYSASEMRQAYKDTCKKIGLQLNHNTDYTEIEGMSTWKNWRYLLTDYEQNTIEEDALDILLSHGFDISIAEEYEEDDEGKIVSATFDSRGVFKLFMWFISYSMPSDFEYKEFKIEAEPINGYWNKELNHQIGYGVFWG